MNFSKIKIIFILLIVGLFGSCDSKPKIIEAQVKNNSSEKFKSNLVNHHQNIDPQRNNLKHHVTVKEVLKTDKYAYLKVNEKNEEYWIAIAKKDVSIGEHYVFTGGLLKKNFYSRVFDKVFDKVFLVSKFWKEGHNSPNKSMEPQDIPTPESLPDLKVEKIQPTEGAISLAQLFSNQPMYDDTIVKITGKCVKVNPKIMNRNWLHIQDGSKGG